jgi:LPXTG-motif cell wall-anchored protein
MAIQRVYAAIAAVLLTAGLIAIAPATGWAQDPMEKMLPPGGGPITLVGCFLRMKVSDEGTKFVLVKPTLGPATTVPEAACAAAGADAMVELDDVHTNVHKHHLDRSKVGRWIEVTGRLEKAGNQALREVHVETYREVPVARPVVATAEPRYVPAPVPPAVHAPLPSVETTAVATSGVSEELPKTASSMPSVALLGLFALAGGFALRLIGRRRTF